MNDLRFALRSLRKSPGFTAIAVVSLAIGIGINTTVFSALDAAFLRPLPFVRPQEIVRVEWPNVSWLDYNALRQQTRTIADLVAVSGAGGVLQDESGTELLGGEQVSANYFSTLGVRPLLGRTFVQQATAATDYLASVVISHALWQRRFGADPAAIGRMIRLSGRAVTIIGVAPLGFSGTRRIPPADFWLLADGGAKSFQNTKDFWLVGRLRSGQSTATARAELEVLIPRTVLDLAPPKPGVPSVVVYSQSESEMDHGGRLATMLIPIVGLVLLVACLNVSSLLLARNEERKREFAVRHALGARRWHLLRQSLVENTIVTLFGTAAALLLTAWAVDVLPLVVPRSMFRIVPELRLDLRTLMVTIASAAGTTLLIGLVPTWRITRVNLSPVLNGNDVPLGQSLRWWSGRNVIVAAQLVVAIVFLGVATLLMRGFFGGKSQDLGFTPKDLLLVNVAPELHGFAGPAAFEYYDRLATQVRRTPGVKSVTFAHHLPLALSGTGFSVKARLPRDVDAPAGGRAIRANVVGAAYFDMLRIPLVRGRAFTARDDVAATRVVVISEALARECWPDADPIGQNIQLLDRGGRPYQIIGVARDIMDRRIGEAPQPYLYLSFLQEPGRAATLVVEPTTGDPSLLANSVRIAMRDVNESVPPLGIETMGNLVRFALLPQWLGAWLAGTLGLLAFLLAVSGLYGAVAYSVVRRTREIGIRMALGATPADALRQVLGHAMRLLAPGLLIGLPLAVGGGFIMRSLLHEVSPMDPLTLAGVSAVATGVVLLASYFPARLASRINPTEALRAE